MVSSNAGVAVHNTVNFWNETVLDRSLKSCRSRRASLPAISRHVKRTCHRFALQLVGHGVPSLIQILNHWISSPWGIGGVVRGLPFWPIPGANAHLTSGSVLMW